MLQKYERFINPLDDDHPFHPTIDLTYDFISKRFPEPGTMLDIGCGSGRLLYVAKKYGWKVKGLNLWESVASSISKTIGVEVLAKDFLQYVPAQGEVYDLVVLRHVLEHLPDSLLAMKGIKSLLRPGSYALLEFPNIDGLDLRYKRLIRKLGLYRKNYPDSYMPGHCNEFCRKSFSFLLSQTGFRLEHWESYSSKPSPTTSLYNRMRLGNKARALIRKTVDTA